MANDSVLTSLTANNTYGSHEFFFYLEFIIVLSVIVFQLIYSFILYKNIRLFQNIFEERLEVVSGYIERVKIGTSADVLSEITFEGKSDDPIYKKAGEGIIKLSLLQTLGDNVVITRIRDTLNLYLTNNFGAPVNFSIIKDIIDREVDVKDEEISQSIPTPLYLGLAATMIGIIFGLWAMPNLSGNGFTEGIDALINGVKIAMLASLMGLTCTTVLSSFAYKRTRRVILRDKNDQLSYLQAKLLPELIRAEDTGLAGLKTSLDTFAREATRTSDNIRVAANQTALNLQAQLNVISKVENLNMTKVTKANLELFDRLDMSMDALKHLTKFLSLMNEISDNLVNFSSKAENLESIAGEIKATLHSSQDVLNFLRLHSESLTAHIDQIHESGDSARKAVEIADSHFREAIEKLDEEVNKRISVLNSTADNAESALKDIFYEIGTKLTEVTDRHVNTLLATYAQVIPQFKQLDNLELLPSLKEEFTLKFADFQNNSTDKSDRLIESVIELNQSLHSLQSSLNHKAILSRLSTIDDHLKRRSIRSGLLHPERGKSERRGSASGNSDNRAGSPGLGGFWRRLFNKTKE